MKGRDMDVKALIGSEGKIARFTAPFLIVGLALNILSPSFFTVGGPPDLLTTISVIMLIPGIIIWIWSVALILTKVPRGELMTAGPYSLVKHPLYTNAALLVLPWIGFLCNTWLGAVMGIIVYVGSRLFSPGEERVLSKKFGAAWDDYCRTVIIPWL